MNERQVNDLVVTLVTVTNLLLAFLISGVVIWALGEDPWFALETMLYGAFGYDEGLGYTLYYTTNFIFTALGFAIGFHCGLFNIGAEGQAYIGGLAVGLLCLWLENWSLWIVFPPGSNCFDHLRRYLGSNTWISESQAWQPRSGNNNYVQLYRFGDHGISSISCAETSTGNVS